MKAPTVFIHTNEAQLIGAHVAAHALRRASRNAHLFQVKILQLSDYPHLSRREGQTYLREKHVMTWRNRDLQSFTPLRFRAPQETEYEGRALVIDPDVFALADIYELLTRDMQGKAIACRLVHPPDGRPAFYASSVMLLDCSRLKHWRWEEHIDQLFAHRLDYFDWVTLRHERSETIGELEEEWNHLDTLTPSTKLLHNTERLTQPWKTGLPVDFNLNYQGRIRARSMRWVERFTQFFRTLPRRDVYQPHPDVAQERLFFSLLRECLAEGLLSEEVLQAHMNKGYLRRDTLRIVHAFTP